MRIPLAKYGIREILLFGGLSLVGIGLSAWFARILVPLFMLALAFILYFFRDPSRRAPTAPAIVLSPADGRVVEVAETVSPSSLLEGPAHKIAIFMSPLDVHVNRSPCRGRVETIERRPGRFLRADRAAASAENESNAIAMADVEGQSVRLLVRQVAGRLARRIVCGVAEGDRLERGQRIGMIKFGSRAEVYVPVQSGFEVLVSLGQRVRAGETILGRFR